MDISLAPPEVVVPNDLQVYRADKLRQIRDHNLIACDWTQMADIPMSDELKTEWRTYRQALRDLPATVGTPIPETETFPDPPTS